MAVAGSVAGSVSGVVFDVLVELPVEVLSDDELAVVLTGCEAVVNRFRARQVAAAAEVDRRGFFRTLGFGSAASWLRVTMGVAHSFARMLVSVGRALREMPLTEKVFASGDVDVSRVRRLVEARAVNPEAFAEGESMLVDAARDLSARDFVTTVQYWKQAADPAGFDAEQKELFERRSVSVSATWGGMFRLDGWLDPESGATVMAAIGSYLDLAACDKADTRSPGQVRADALTDICRFVLDHGHLPVKAGERPHVLVIADYEALLGRVGARAEISGVGPITADAARRLTCDAKLSRVVTKGRSLPLEVGRATRTATVGQRRALMIRDRGCVVSGCRMPPQWTDAHHITHWVDGGASDIGNYVLLCRRHHRAVHEGRVTLIGYDGTEIPSVCDPRAP